MPTQSFALYSEPEFNSFCTGLDQHNRITMLRFWNMAKIKKILLVLKKTAPRMMLCLLMSPGEVNRGKVVPRFRVGTIFTGKITDDNFHVFGTNAIIGPIKEAFENGLPIKENHSDNTTNRFEPKRSVLPESNKIIGELPVKKKRGRPRKV